MASAQIVIDQGALSPGIGGRSRDDLATGSAVTLSNDNDSGVRSWRWELLAKPDGSTAALSNSTAAAPTFTPDLPGTYRVRLSVNTGQTGEVDTRVAIIRDASGYRVPATGESTEANYALPDGTLNEDGYSPDLQALLEKSRTGGTRDYISVSMSANQVNPSNGTAIAFDTTDASASLNLALSSNQITGLQTGKAYLILVDISISMSAAGRTTWELYDVTAAAQLQQRSVPSPSQAVDAMTPISMSYIYVASQTTTISVRHLATSGVTPTYIGTDAGGVDKSRMQVIEL